MVNVMNAKKSRRARCQTGTASQIRNMENLFKDRKDFNADITKWDTSNVVTMNNMFEGAISFNQPIGAWDTGKVTDMSNMFQRASRFNQNIINWDVSHVTNMRSMFAHAEDFNQPLERWDVRKVKDMFYMFTGAKNFQHPIHTRGKVWLRLFRLANGEESSMEPGHSTIDTSAEIRKVLSMSDRFLRACQKSWRRNLHWQFRPWANRQENKSWFSTILPALREAQVDFSRRPDGCRRPHEKVYSQRRCREQ